MIIRFAEENDRPAIAAVQATSWRSAYADVLTQEYLDTRLNADVDAHWKKQPIREGDVVMVADDGGVVGFIAIWLEPEPYIDNLHVLPQARSKGLGRALMQAAATALLEAGHSTAYLWVVAENAGAIRFYEALGGELSDRADHDLFGNMVPNIKIVWDDIGAIVAAG